MGIFIGIVVLVFFSLAYELGLDEQTQQNKIEKERLKEEAKANAIEKARIEAEDQRIASERAKIESSKKADENRLTVSQLVIYSSIFIAIAVAIILFFKTISSS